MVTPYSTRLLLSKTFAGNAEPDHFMLNAKQCVELKSLIPDFSLEHPCKPASSLPLLQQSYLEFYGFFETIKAMELDYFWGYRVFRREAEEWRIATHYWRLAKAKGIVFLVHGLFDHVGLYQTLISYFLSQGYSVIAADMPGHGLSDGPPTQVDNFHRYGEVVRDTLTFFKTEIADAPLYGVGQSTGAAVLMGTAFFWERQAQASPFARLVFLAPLVRPNKWWLGRLAYRMFGRYLKRIHRDFSIPNSHDTAFNNFLRYHDPLQTRSLSIQWIGALHHWVETFPAQPVVATPLLIVQGTSDLVVDWRFNVKAIQEHFTSCQVNYIKGAMHHLANEGEPWRKPTFAGVGQFFRQRAMGGPE